MTDNHLADIVLSQAYDKIKKSAGFICIVPKGQEDNPSLVKQIEFARSINKPFYLIMQCGANIPRAAVGANIRVTLYAGNDSEKEQEYIVRKAIKQLREDFPDSNGKLSASPDISDLT